MLNNSDMNAELLLFGGFLPPNYWVDGCPGVDCSFLPKIFLYYFLSACFLFHMLSIVHFTEQQWECPPCLKVHFHVFIYLLCPPKRLFAKAEDICYNAEENGAFYNGNKSIAETMETCLPWTKTVGCGDFPWQSK